MANDGQAVLHPPQVNVWSNLPYSAHSLSTMPDGATRVTSTSTLETSPLKLQQGGAYIHTGLFARFTRDYVLRADP